MTDRRTVFTPDADQIRRFLDTEMLQLASSIDKMDETTLAAARDMILHAEADGGRVHVTGIGKPGRDTLLRCFLPPEHLRMCWTGRKPCMAVRVRSNQGMW